MARRKGPGRDEETQVWTSGIFVSFKHKSNLLISSSSYSSYSFDILSMYITNPSFFRVHLPRIFRTVPKDF